MNQQGAARAVVRAGEWAGIALSFRQLELFRAYAQFLLEEAIPAGGLGPSEGSRVWERHLADSLSMAAGWREGAPAELLDVGSGAGLPGIPLAIAWPQCRVTLLDKGGRRTTLLARAVRVLGIENAAVVQADVFDVADSWQAVTFRGSVTPPEAIGLTAGMLEEDGTAALALSRKRHRPERAEDLVNLALALSVEAQVVRVPEEALDGGAWLLIMRRRGGNS